MKEYPCYLSKTKICIYGGNKYYNFGFLQGTSSFCRLVKKFCDKLNKCPKDNK
jgi:hypothetical protein